MSVRTKVAILTGGNSSEREVSLASAKVVEKHLSSLRKYNVKTIDITHQPWTVLENGKAIGQIDLNDFSYQIDGMVFFFDVVFVAIHGTPAEDGKLQGYFDLLNIPYTCCSALASAITFDKDICKQLLKDLPIKQAQSVLLNRNKKMPKAVNTFEFPVFVKPNKNGSSYGTSKVNEPSQLEEAVQKAFVFDDEVLVEEYIKGRELACGVIEQNGKLIALPITEIISENEFFDYEAKYQGKSEEITPALIPKYIEEKAKIQAKKIYRKLKLSGAVRIDYFLKGKELYILEVNTIPGLSAESILPQEAVAHGFELSEFFDIMVQETLAKHQANNE